MTLHFKNTLRCFGVFKMDPSNLSVGQSIPPPIITPGPVRDDFLKQDASSLDEHQRKYCRCLLKVEAKGSARSPYGICTKSTGGQVHSCSQYYDFGAMDIDMLLAYMSLHNLPTGGITTREDALRAIGQWKQSKGETF